MNVLPPVPPSRLKNPTRLHTSSMLSALLDKKVDVCQTYALAFLRKLLEHFKTTDCWIKKKPKTVQLQRQLTMPLREQQASKINASCTPSLSIIFGVMQTSRFSKKERLVLPVGAPGNGWYGWQKCKASVHHHASMGSPQEWHQTLLTACNFANVAAYRRTDLMEEDIAVASFYVQVGVLFGVSVCQKQLVVVPVTFKSCVTSYIHVP